MANRKKSRISNVMRKIRNSLDSSASSLHAGGVLQQARGSMKKLLISAVLVAAALALPALSMAETRVVVVHHPVHHPVHHRVVHRRVYHRPPPRHVIHHPVVVHHR